MTSERRQIQLDESTARDGFEKYRAAELAAQAWQDWLQERYEAYGLDPEGDEVRVNPVTGRITVVIKRPVREGAPSDTAGASVPASDAMETAAAA